MGRATLLGAMQALADGRGGAPRPRLLPRSKSYETKRIFKVAAGQVASLHDSEGTEREDEQGQFQVTRVYVDQTQI